MDCRISICGGGNLITNGGGIRLNGQLISQQKDGQSSTISIYGGKITTTGGVQNLAGSTLTIGADNNGTMGKLIVGVGQKVNNSGVIVIDLAGAQAGIIKPFINTNGNSSSLITGNTQISVKNGNSDFANATGFDNASGTINFTINQNAIDSFKSTLNNNERATLEQFSDNIYTISGANSTNLKSTANDINRAVFSVFYATNLSIIESLSADNFMPNSKQSITKRTKTSNPRQTRQRQIRKISTKATNPNDINAGFIVQGISSNSANGILGGFKVGYGHNFTNTRFALNFAYAYGSLQSAVNSLIATQNLTTKSHNLALGANLNAQIVGNFGFDLGIVGAMSLADNTRRVESNALNVDSHLQSNQKLYQIALKTAFDYDFKICNFTITPFIGLNQGFLAMPKFAESNANQSNSAFALSAKAYNSYFLYALMGVKMGFDLGNYGVILADLEYKFLVYRSQKERILHYAQSGDILRFAIPPSHKISFDLGYQKDFNAWFLQVPGNFSAIFNTSKSNETNANFYNYGLDAKFGWRF